MGLTQQGVLLYLFAILALHLLKEIATCHQKGRVNYSLLLKAETDTGIQIEFRASGGGLFGFSSCFLLATVNGLCGNSALTAQIISQSLCAANAILVFIYCHS